MSFIMCGKWEGPNILRLAVCVHVCASMCVRLLRESGEREPNIFGEKTCQEFSFKKLKVLDAASQLLQDPWEDSSPSHILGW